MIAAGLLYLGLFALAAAMGRQGQVLIGPWATPARVAWFPRLGWALVALSLAAALLGGDWSVGLVSWLGWVPLLSAVILLALTYGARLAQGAVVAAVLLPLILAIAAPTTL